jgi:preprotein translocase subunit SecB
MHQAPLQLVDYFLTSFHLDANPEFNPSLAITLDWDSLNVTPEVRQEGEATENGTKWFVSLHIKQSLPKGKNLPYQFTLQIQGIVLASPHLTESTLARSIHANGPAMLFGAAREIIRAATGRGPWPAVIIPSTNFLAGLPPEKTKDTAQKRSLSAKSTTTPSKTKKAR